MDVSLGQALAWRADRQFLVTGAASAVDVVRRLVALPAWSGDPALTVRRRLASPSPDALTTAVRDGEVIRTYAFRGSTHFFAAADAGTYMAVRCANRQWELPSWQAHYQLTPDDWPALRDIVRAAVAREPVTQVELAERVAKTARFEHLRGALASSQTLLKPLAWQGDVCFGPDEDGEPTFQSPSSNPQWTGLTDLDVAGRQAVLAYLAAYGPATRAHLHYWLNDGLSAGRRRLDGWIDDLAGDGTVVDVLVDGSPMLHPREHLASLAATTPAPDHVVMLAGYDQWVLGPGTADARIVPHARRSAVTRGANVVLRAGQVVATWKLDGGTLSVSWFAETGPVPQTLEVETERLSALLDRHLTLAVAVS